MLEGDSDGEDDAELLGLCSGKFSLSQGRKHFINEELRNKQLPVMPPCPVKQ